MNLKEKPFYLNDTDVEWVNKTVESLTDDEKIEKLKNNNSATSELLDRY